MGKKKRVGGKNSNFKFENTALLLSICQDNNFKH